MNKGCDRMRTGTCQYFNQNIKPKIWSNNGITGCPEMEYKMYCDTFDNFERCPYYSTRNFNNQQIRDEYKRNQDASAKGGMATLIIIGVIIVVILKSCGVF